MTGGDQQIELRKLMKELKKDCEVTLVLILNHDSFSIIRTKFFSRFCSKIGLYKLAFKFSR